MKNLEANNYRCPGCVTELKLTITRKAGAEVIAGKFKCNNGHSFEISNGIPDFTLAKELADVDKETKATYEKLANEYEKYASLPFQTFGVDEKDLRKKMIEQLCIKEDSVVLEIGGGDGRGAEHIVQKLKSNGKLYFQELSPGFMKKSFERLKSKKDIVEFSIANGSYLSFPDNYFDAAYHFGGINTFNEVERCLKELARVVKPGGKVLVGDEGLGPWLKETEFGKIMVNSNPLIGYEVPFEKIPVEARNVKVEWVMMGAFFLLEFTVDGGEPLANYHIKIPSERGGTHWTRYYGNLEGITSETKKLAIKARRKSGKSMHDWLDEVVRKAANEQLKE